MPFVQPLGFMPSPRTMQLHDPFSSSGIEKPEGAYPNSLGRKGLSFHVDSLENNTTSASILPEAQKPKDAKRNSGPLVSLAKCSDVKLGVDACTESRGLWVIVQALQTQQDKLAQTLDTAVLELQEQMRVMKSDIVRTQLEFAADKNQTGESDGSQALLTRCPGGSTARTAFTQEDVHQSPFDREILQQNQREQQAGSLNHDIIGIANEVCDMFAGPLNVLTESVRRAESDMEHLRSAFLDVQERQERHSHGANEMRVGMAKLDKMVCQVLDVMKIEERQSKLPQAADTLRPEPKIENDRLVGSSCGTPPVPRLTYPIKLTGQKLSPTLASESPRTCGSTASGSNREETRSNASTLAGTEASPELWKTMYGRLDIAEYWTFRDRV